MSAFDEAEAATSSGPRGGGAGGRILRPVAVRPTGPPSSINSTGSASGGGLYEAQVMAISQSLRDLANLQPATRRQVDQIGTRLDTIELRTKIKAALAKCGEHAGSASRAIEQFATPPGGAGEPSNRDSSARRTQLKKFRMDLEKLSAAQSDLDSLAKSALLLHPQPTAAAGEEASRAAAADDRDRRRGGPRTGGAAAAAEDDPLLMARLQQVDMNESIVAERNAAIADIAQEMSEVHDTYQRLAGMVDEQGVELDQAETNVIDAQASTEAGVGHLTQASSYQKQYGRCLLILVAILLVIALGVGGYFGYKAYEKDKK